MCGTKEALINIGMSEEEAQKVVEDTKQLREDLAKHYGCTPKEAQERFLRIPEGDL